MFNQTYLAGRHLLSLLFPLNLCNPNDEVSEPSERGRSPPSSVVLGSSAVVRLALAPAALAFSSASARDIWSISPVKTMVMPPRRARVPWRPAAGHRLHRNGWTEKTRDESKGRITRHPLIAVKLTTFQRKSRFGIVDLAIRGETHGLASCRTGNLQNKVRHPNMRFAPRPVVFEHPFFGAVALRIIGCFPHPRTKHPWTKRELQRPAERRSRRPELHPMGTVQKDPKGGYERSKRTPPGAPGLATNGARS